MIKVAVPQIEKDDILEVLSSLLDGDISGRSNKVKDFEDAFAFKMGSKYASAVNSGTNALFLALKSLGIKAGDEVIIPNYAYIAVANAVSYTGATPVLCDVESDTYNIDWRKIRTTPNTKAIIAVHTYGHPCDMDNLMSFDVPVIEDAAEAHGALYKGRMVGTIGTIGCFSFWANKTITTGEGGMIITNDPKIDEYVKSYRDQCSDKEKYEHFDIGYSMCMGALQAALGLSQLRKLDRFLKRKKEIADTYDSQLCSVLGKAVHKEYAEPSHWIYTVESNQKLVDYLRNKGIDTRPPFVPIHLQKPYKQDGDFKVSEEVAKKIICLPSSVGLSNEEQMEVIREIKNSINFGI